ncbi:3-isopropylmalate dehydrogenase [Leadbettera azotonutricia]|uniref:3-isopropylmalate dehydrogenase n=1 Tax=Leadbettera azotonutricia (strain ATCC BAA-888 / DSM 13862 / ZAS-9) TaxID=545695 RepID=F5YB40_LEAAZ|nr:3-isopropylmalate dehydrogenase [Leadbettera azotonutricia]AEF80089.1 3-isopropylmalate dehydrogenase [Leadbettera azotonutricia ZAS-9]
MSYQVALVPGDGIGPEVMVHATEILDAIGDKYDHVFNYVELEAGGKAIDSTGEPLPADTLEAAQQCDALLLAAVGGPKWDTLPGHLRPERALLGLRAGLGVFANLRPAALLPQLRQACPIKDEVLAASNPEGKASFDLLIVRELTGGLYFGKRGRIDEASGGHSPGAAFDTETYSWTEIERVLRAGYDAAKVRRHKLCIVDKANVLESSRYWREVAAVVSKDYPDIETSYLYVDNAAMQLIRAPGQFDVIVTSNLFGDILSDEASVLTGSIGMLPSASLGSPADPLAKNGRPMGMYEPIHGSAPDIADQDIANPLAMILSAAMMLRYSFGLEKEAKDIERAVNKVLDDGLRTKDIVNRSSGGANEKVVGTKEMGAAVRKALEE